MIHTWNRSARHGIKIVNRLSLVLEEVGPSITITTLTNVITFSIGSFTPTPGRLFLQKSLFLEIQLFCTATAIALALAYLYCLILFVPVLYYASKYEDSHSSSSKKPLKLKETLSSWCQTYSQIIQNRFFNLALFLGIVFYWYASIQGVIRLDTKLDTHKIIPPDNPLSIPNEYFMKVVYQEYYPVTVFVNKPLDIRKKEELDRFYRMLDEFEGMRLCRGKKRRRNPDGSVLGKELTILWLRDYINYINTYEDFDYYGEYGAPEDPLKPTTAETGVDLRRLKEFLASPIYKYYKSFMKLDNHE